MTTLILKTRQDSEIANRPLPYAIHPREHWER